MSSIYDNPRYREILDAGRCVSSLKEDISAEPERDIIDATDDVEDKHAVILQNDNTEIQSFNNHNEELASFQQRSVNALKLVDDIVLKNYLTKLSDMEVVPFLKEDATDEIVVYKVNKMVYEKDEYATDKFISIISAMTYTDSSVFMIVDGHKTHTDFYLGIKCNDEKRSKGTVAETFKNAVLGQFPGSCLDDEFSIIKSGAKCSEQEKLFYKISEANSISSCTIIPSYKNSKGEYTNANFIQGIEKFAAAMQGKVYTAVILASNTTSDEIVNIRKGYESIYTELSAMATQQLAYSTNESLANAISRTKGISSTISESDTVGSSISESTSSSHTEGTSESHTDGKSESKENFWAKASRLSSPLMQAGAILTATGVGALLGGKMMGAGVAAGLGGIIGGKQLGKSSSDTKGISTSDTVTKGKTKTENTSTTKGTSQTDSISDTEGTTTTMGSSKNFTITVQNKRIQEILKKIDKQLERVAVSESTGLWSAGAYFLSYENDRATAETGATIFRSIMQGEQSGVEISALNTWYNDNGNHTQSRDLLSYICDMRHPIFNYHIDNGFTDMSVMPVSLLSSKELAIMLGLPRKSVPGLPVVEHASLGKEVVRLSTKECYRKMELGSIYDQGVVRENNRVWLDAQSMTQHTFVTGSTGCGKSETVYKLIDCARKSGAKFLIIEPAKGEYKNVFGTEYIYGTNPLMSNLLKINPFKFTKGVHVLEHADRLIEIFNVCWPMYAAMPAVLKEAVLNAYEDCGWDLIKSTNKYSENLFPTFADLIQELEWVINTSAYSEEVKSNYKGSLVTRVKSLANGINGQIFSGEELGDARLFDENVIVDISRIGSQETKALIMGVLIMRLNEYRANSNIEANSKLRHVTILEEAHNILKKCSQEQSMEGSNVAGKSVEMISNAIAEMRTYGEGFIIVDQSPGAVDISAIRNTNTKIIMRLPEDSDRKVAGRAAAMKDSQIDEIAKLPTGVAVVYQNDWEEPVLCKVDMYDGKRLKYEFKEELPSEMNQDSVKIEVLKFLLKGRVYKENISFDKEQIIENVDKLVLSTFTKLNIYEALIEHKEIGELSLWKDTCFEKLSRIVTEIFGVRSEVHKLCNRAKSMNEVTLGLEQLICKKIKDVPNNLYNVIEQCFMRDFSLVSKENTQFYGTWLSYAKSLL